MKFKRLLSAIIAIVMLEAPAFAEYNNESLYLDTIFNYVSNLYIDEDVNVDSLLWEAVNEAVKDNPELMYSMIKSAFSTLDEYSDFYTAEEFKNVYQSLNSVFYGIGVMIHQADGNISVIQVLDGGGAEASGIMENDIILAVDGVSVKGYSVNEVVNMVAGEAGTMVNIKILRDGAEMEFAVERRMVNQSTVSYAIYENNIGYIKIISFSDITAKEFEDVLAVFNEEGVTKIILDLRNNPGGLLDAAVSVANLIVPEGPILHVMYRRLGNNVTYSSENKDSKYKFAVLVNKNTASAAEVLTGALQDSGAGYIVGETTYGKGLIQDVITLGNGDAFKLTTGQYLTRNGNNIQDIGIYPDEVSKNGTAPIDVTQYEQFDSVTKWKIGDKGTGVLAAKQRLSILGYYTGPVDDNFDTMLEHSVYKFQEDTNLYPYGVLDFSTQATLENAFAKVNVIIDDQFDAAYNYLLEN